MICPECAKLGVKGIVHIGVSMTTDMMCERFNDKEGRYHRHDLNTTTTQYECSNGHRWTESEQGSCWCGWPNSGPFARGKQP